jgi:hypothetical protein
MNAHSASPPEKEHPFILKLLPWELAHILGFALAKSIGLACGQAA